ncbi:MAG: hypothetical protein HN366_23715 [Deltaproteobacteria bacterium]|jgi:tetratricopeptide (TPR) repeat protein|nr:hypothetical protein [Deltaproteobacteria bacterium]
MPAQLQEALKHAVGDQTFPKGEKAAKEDTFFSMDDLVPVKKDAAKRSLKRVLSEMEELIREKKWEDAVALFYPVEEKQPELSANGMEIPVRAKTAFALGQLQRFDHAIAELTLCIKGEPDNFYHHSSLAYTAYNSLFAAQNRDVFLSGKVRSERVELAHRHFRRAQVLRPTGVTNFYREGMLYQKIEGKSVKALPLFQTAVACWDNLSREERKARHQERKNFVKALYRLSGVLLERGDSSGALKNITRVLSEDEKSGYLSLVFKYFALGKIHFHLNRFDKARDALLFALQSGTGGNHDFVHELLSRTYLAMGNPQRALEVILKIPERRRRPYCRWTEADVLCALKRYGQARAALLKSGERDTRSRHKSLIRLVKIAYVENHLEQAMAHAADADRFFQEKWGNRFLEGIFWQGVCAYRLGRKGAALVLARELKALKPDFPKLNVLLEKLEG